MVNQTNQHRLRPQSIKHNDWYCWDLEDGLKNERFGWSYERECNFLSEWLYAVTERQVAAVWGTSWHCWMTKRDKKILLSFSSPDYLSNLWKPYFLLRSSETNSRYFEQNSVQSKWGAWSHEVELQQKTHTDWNWIAYNLDKLK